MKLLKRFGSQCSLSIGVAVALAASLSVARADTWDKKTIVSFSHPVEVPGYVLQPGIYVMKLVDSQSNRHIVQFVNERQNRVYASAIAIPAYRTQVTGRTVITFYEAAARQPEPMHYWYYPGDNFGQEFIYPKDHLREIAALRPAPSYDSEAQRKAEPTPLTSAEPLPDSAAAQVAVTTQPQTQDTAAIDADRSVASDAPVEIAQAFPPSPQENAAPAGTSAAPETSPAPEELPHTSGNYAGIAMLGLVAIGGAFSARKLRRF